MAFLILSKIINNLICLHDFLFSNHFLQFKVIEDARQASMAAGVSAPIHEESKEPSSIDWAVFNKTNRLTALTFVFDQICPSLAALVLVAVA